jgi:DNA-binding response OmpR family regulator
MNAMRRTTNDRAAPAPLGRSFARPTLRRRLGMSLLEVMLANEGRILTKKFLLEKVWDIQFDPGTNVVDAMICRLRRKIDAPGQPSHLQTVRGKGYVLQALS